MTREVRVTSWRPFPHYNFTHVRIWTKETQFGWWQRHEWKKTDGTTDMEEWITTPTKQHAAGSTLVKTED